MFYQVSSVNGRSIVEDFKHYLDQSCAQWYSAAKLKARSTALLVLVPACSYIQYLMEPSPEFTVIISDKHKMAFEHCLTLTVPSLADFSHGETLFFKAYQYHISILNGMPIKFNFLKYFLPQPRMFHQRPQTGTKEKLTQSSSFGKADV